MYQTEIRKTVETRNIYVASSWRNERQPEVVQRLLDEHHQVYDFRNPNPDDTGFSWRSIDPNWENWTNEEYLWALKHPLAEKGFRADFDAMKWADTFVLVLPCGRSAHLELGWACGQGKRTIVLLEQMEPELMIKMVDYVCLTLDGVVEAVEAD